MEGMPESVSAVRRTAFTSRLPRRAYSARYTLAHTPMGTAASRDKAVMQTVFTRAGIMDWFLVVKRQANRSQRRWGTPVMRI